MTKVSVKQELERYGNRAWLPIPICAERHARVRLYGFMPPTHRM
jgi:hypothetical protein